MSYSAFKRYALICALAIWTTPVGAQEPAASPPASSAAPRRAPATARSARPRPTPPTPNSPHGPRRASPRVMPAADLPPGEIEVRLNAKDLEGIENQEVTLLVSKQSIERGNVDTTLTARTDMRGVARFTSQPTESDHVYQVRVNAGPAQFSTQQFQFRAAERGLRIIVPIYEAQSSLDGMLVLTRTLLALVPQDDMFVIDVLFRVENYSEVAWVPENVVLPLPEGFKALNFRDEKSDARFEAAGDVGVKLTGTLPPGQHDLMFRFHLPTNDKAERVFSFPTSLNTSMVRVILEASPSMQLSVAGFPEPQETRNQDGQRRLIAGRDFMSEKVRAPDQIEVKIAGIPTPAAGRSVAVGLAAALALFGVAQGVSRRRKNPRASDLTREDRERASELLLEELISLEQAFQQGAIGRKTHEQAKRQLLEAFARLRAEPEGAESAA